MSDSKKYPWNRTKRDAQDARQMEGVYAGPDFFASAVTPPDLPPQIEMPAYAGPEYFSPQPPAVDSRMFMMVYAGPEYFASDPDSPDANDRRGQKLDPSVLNAPRVKLCSACLATIPESAKFCPECGTPQPREDE